MELGLLLMVAFGLTLAENVIVGYYAPWSGVGVEDIPFDKVTHINYAFGVLLNKNDPASISMNFDKELPQLKKLKSLANDHDVKVLISIGGWTGSQTFSLMAKDPGTRTRFIENAMWFLEKEVGMDGIDLDWEYPGRKGAPCNSFSPFDSENYLLVLKELRAAVDKKFLNRLITAAVRVLPFDGPSGNPMTDVSAFVPYFDFVNVMTYDIMGPWSDSTGPNSPLHHDARGEQLSMSSSIQSWIRAGFPANKLTAGVAFYGHSMTSKVDMTLDPTNQYAPKLPNIPRGDVDDSNEPNAMCSEGANFSGEWKYRHLRKNIIGKNTTFERFWDDTTLTPWLFDKITHTFISYDDPQSLKLKANFIKQLNLKGVMIWDLGMDYKDELVDSLQSVRSSPTSSKPIPTVTITVTTTISLPTVTLTLPQTKTTTSTLVQTKTATTTSTLVQTKTITTTSTLVQTKTVTTTFTSSKETSSLPKPTSPTPCIPDTGECLVEGSLTYMKKCLKGNQWAIYPCRLGSSCTIHQGKVYCAFNGVPDFNSKLVY